ncbi:DUF167 family protein [Hyphomonas sp. WL0036]|uniref:DUF167 family protein n=1 Tax=Hyphomonas sediminis TaxID=2866160 RepID=UPI001C811843|nr:DUF167 family protein [Hyphomonas sediminis]MBY9066317.1 DUF167 family protein [Hyphomonas sediminis]
MRHRLTVRVQPKASSDRLDGWARDDAGRSFLKLRVRALPEEGAANAAVEALVAKALGLPKSAVKVVTGGKNRLKGLDIEGPDELAARISGLAGGSDGSSEN